MAEVAGTPSPTTGKPYTVSLLCRVWNVSRSNVYFLAAKQEADGSEPARRRGPQGPCSDDAMVGHIRGVIEDSPFVGEGYRKVWARLRYTHGIRKSKDRVRRLMRENDLQGHYHPRRQRGNKARDGRITTDTPNEMWGTDACAVMTRKHGLVTVFLAIDHCTSECIGLHAAKPGTAYEALEPIRQGLQKHFGGYDEGVASGLALRHDHGSQYTSDLFQRELEFLGVRSTTSYVAEPECNGVSERFVKTLKEQCLWLHAFDTVEDVLKALATFKETYNQGWMVAKHGYRSPVRARERLLARAAA